MSLLHPLDGDGTAFNLYYILSKKPSRLDMKPLRFKIPDTIVFHNFPTAWYYWTPLPKVEALQFAQQDPANPSHRATEYGEIRRKGGKDLAKANILKHFRRNETECDIVASFITRIAPGDPACSIQFFNGSELEEFLDSQHNGILQAFIRPSGDRNEMLQAVWSPQVCHVSKQVNRYRMSDHSRSRYDRAVTFEGAAHFSDDVYIAPRTEHKVRLACQSIVEHFALVEHHYSISRMVIYLKEDANKSEVLWLLFSSSIRIYENRFKESKPPLNLTPQFQTERLKLVVPDDPLQPRSVRNFSQSFLDAAEGNSSSATTTELPIPAPDELEAVAQTMLSMFQEEREQQEVKTKERQQSIAKKAKPTHSKTRLPAAGLQKKQPASLPRELFGLYDAELIQSHQQRVSLAVSSPNNSRPSTQQSMKSWGALCFPGKSSPKNMTPGRWVSLGWQGWISPIMAQQMANDADERDIEAINELKQKQRLLKRSMEKGNQRLSRVTDKINRIQQGLESEPDVRPEPTDTSGTPVEKKTNKDASQPPLSDGDNGAAIDGLVSSGATATGRRKSSLTPLPSATGSGLKTSSAMTFPATAPLGKTITPLPSQQQQATTTSSPAVNRQLEPLLHLEALTPQQQPTAVAMAPPGGSGPGELAESKKGTAKGVLSTTSRTTGRINSPGANPNSTKRGGGSGAMGSPLFPAGSPSAGVGAAHNASPTTKRPGAPFGGRLLGNRNVAAAPQVSIQDQVEEVVSRLKPSVFEHVKVTELTDFYRRAGELEDAIYWCYSNLSAQRMLHAKRYEFVVVPTELETIVREHCRDIRTALHMWAVEEYIAHVEDELGASQSEADRKSLANLLNAICHSCEGFVTAKKQELMDAKTGSGSPFSSLPDSPPPPPIAPHLSTAGATSPATAPATNKSFGASASSSTFTFVPPKVECTLPGGSVYVVVLFSEARPDACRYNVLMQTVRSQINAVGEQIAASICGHISQHLHRSLVAGWPNAIRKLRR